MLAPGVVLNGRYQLTRRIASGGMGEVWRGTDLLLHREIAVKVLLPALMADEEFITRFRTEARTMAALRHPGIVQVHDYGARDDQSDFLVMEYIDGTPLSKRIKEAGRLGTAETMTIVAQVADALRAAHEAGIVHRDVKPSNLLVRPGGAIVLVDFGVARSAGVDGITSTNVVMGSAHYMAPEQAEGRPVSAATDVYALGAVAFSCLAGRPPYVGDNALAVLAQLVHGRPPELPADVPAAAARVVLRALAKDPAQRFPDAAALAAAAREAAQPVAAAPAAAPPAARVSAPAAAPLPPPPAPEPPPGEPSAESGRRRRTAVLVTAGVVVLALAGSGLVHAFQPADGPGRIPPPVAQNLPAGDALPAAPPGASPSGRPESPEATAPARSRGAGTTPRDARPSAPAAAPTTPTSGAPATGPAASPSPTPATSTSATPKETGTTNPYEPAQVCGSGFQMIDSAVLQSAAGAVQGRVHLLHHSNGKNCVVTVKAAGVGTKTAMSAYLQVEGKKKLSDSGSFDYYAGPVRRAAAATCVKWGGSIGSLSYDSPFEHCG